LTIAKLLPLLLFIIVGFFFIKEENYQAKEFPAFGSFSSTVLLLVFAFGGFESVLVNSGEVKDPEKNLPFSLLLAALIIASIYMLVQIVSIGVLPTLASTDKPLADASQTMIGKTGAFIITLGAMFSITGTLNAIMLVGSRLPFAFSEEDQFPKFFSFIHPKYKTPTWSLLLFMTITILISLNYDFLKAASISAITRVMIYAIVCVTLIILRKKRSEQTQFFKIKYGNVFAILGVLIAIWLLSSAKQNELIAVAIALGIGLVIYIITLAFKKK
jgi:amino acid transporter